MRKKISFSFAAIVFSAITWIIVFFNLPGWQRKVIDQDVVSYYGYLPSTFIYHDLTLRFSADPFFADKIWTSPAQNGNPVFKMTMGMSVLYSPFFFAGHLYAKIFSYPCNGYSQPYITALILGTFFYLLLGLYYLRKLLLRFVPDPVAAITLLIILFATNLYWYSFFEYLMAHVYLFTLITIFIFYTLKWKDNPAMRHALVIGITGGLAFLIRPSSIVFFLFPVVYWLHGKKLEEILSFLLNYKWHIFIIVALCGAIFFPQILYWKKMTGSWLYYSYGDEHFYFSHPHITDVLFSARKGWLVYTPVMLLSLAGFIILWKRDRKFFMAAFLSLAAGLYVISSWWCWWYGGSFGQRSFIDFYGLLAVPLALTLDFLFSKKKLVRIFTVVMIFLFATLNIFQSLQYKKGSLHYDSMTWNAYRIGFFQMLDKQLGWKSALCKPDYENAKKGLPEKPGCDQPND